MIMILTIAPDKGKHEINLCLRGVPVINQFVQREAEMRELERYFLEKPTATPRRRVVVVHGPGGIGKTQLAVEFAREYRRRFSSIIWLDGSSEASLKQSFADMIQKLPHDDLTADGVESLKHPVIAVEVAVCECLRWLSLPSNHQWLLIMDNVDRAFYNMDDQQAHEVKNYFPYADQGSILITSRLASLQKYGLGLMVETINAEQSRAILENNAGGAVNGELTVAYLKARIWKLTHLNRC
jgi:superfamily II DNA or RNA helicase